MVMEEYRSRKRPFNARASEEDGGIANDGADGTGNVVDLVTEEKMMMPPNPKRTHANANVEGCFDNNINTTPSIQQTGTANACDDSDCDSDGGEDEEIPVIRDLQKSLEYLVSERNIESVYNNGNGRQCQQQQQKEIIHPTITGTNQHNHQHDDEQLNKIPNLVNRILLEHYYSSNYNNHAPVIDANNNNGCTSNTNHANPNSNMLSRTQHDKMTQLLIAVIVEFAEPYYAKMTRYRQQERRRLLLLQQQQQQKEGEQKKKKKREKKQHHQQQQQQQQQQGQSNNTPSQDNIVSSLIKFDERAASWATSCLKQLLLQPPPILPSSSSMPNFNTVIGYGDTIRANNDHENNPHIPELDALLAASGSHDGMKMEEQIQNALIYGVHGRRLLKSMGM